MEIVQLYTLYKPLLLSISYRMLGSLSEAEDIVHEIFTDIQEVEIKKISNLKAYLCKMVTNRSIDYLKSAKKNREVYMGPWLPEPLIIEDKNDPLTSVLQHDQLSYALLSLMEQLNPIERAVFVLREAFDYKFEEIASFVGKEESNCRKVLSRVRKKLHLNGDFQSVKKEQTEEVSNLIHQFIYASNTGNSDELIRLLCEDAVLYTDGGGKVTAAINPIVTSRRIVQFILGLLKKYSKDPSLKVQMKNINGQSGIIIESDVEPSSVVCFDIDNNQVQQIFIIRNPDKLKHLGKQVT
jgi:RNA polymerase sigma-70 factor, ECF subfamily